MGVFVGFLDNELPSALLRVDLTEHIDLFADAAEYHQGDFRMCQFLWPDRGGRLPWEPGYDERLLLAQPVLGSLE